MSSSTDKEHARRAAIEAVWVRPPDPDPKHATRDDERPRTAKTILAAIHARGLGDPFDIEEWSATVWDLPRWRTVNSDDTHLSYAADPLLVYHLGALRELVPGKLCAVEVMYLGGKPTRARVGTGKQGGRGVWNNHPVMQLAKAIREHP